MRYWGDMRTAIILTLRNNNKKSIKEDIKILGSKEESLWGQVRLLGGEEDKDILSGEEDDKILGDSGGNKDFGQDGED